MNLRLICGLALGVFTLSASAQTVVSAGSGSYASTPPAYKSSTDAHDGYNAGRMLTRRIYCDELPGRPIPTNDWWTDIINNPFSGSLWSYPAMLRTGDYGVQINRPSYWADEGKEIKSRTSLTVSAPAFIPEAAIATDWHDLDVAFRMPDTSRKGAEMRVTAAHGIPFTWFEFTKLTPTISIDEGSNGDTAVFFGTYTPKEGTGRCGIRIGDDFYGIYFPAGTELKTDKDIITFLGAEWVSVAILNSEDDLSLLQPYAAGVVSDSQVDWEYSPDSGSVTTRWHITTRNLADPTSSTPVILGLLPHAYKYSSTEPQRLGALSYMTPRGEMRMYEDAAGHFAFDASFSGMMPYYAAPREDLSTESGFRTEVLETLMRDYAEKGSFGADTYWGGKGLVQMALNMTFAKQSDNQDLYLRSRTRLREAFEDWLKYTPGEDAFFFSYYPRWGSMLGFNVSYDSDTFNDHHFHYGYFTYAAALLCLEDEEFAREYGEILSLIAKDYANYDRSDTRFPFMRTLDPWCGHSWAGGLGDAGNDNGNGQESTSEAMQSWGGLYLLGVALGDDEMRDAGIWGWSTEARATREYWFDIDAPRPANDGGRKPWPGKGDHRGNYNYDDYKYAYNSNITGKGIGWWTWFGGDPLFMHGIQWMPVSPALDYLSWDNDFVDWAYSDMMAGANSTFSHDWFLPTYNTDNGEEIQPLADNDWGNVTLAYMQRSRPMEAAEIFERARREGRHIATAVSTAHISYYLIHHHLTYGELDPAIRADLPTASAFVKEGKTTFMVYNPYNEEKTVNFYCAGELLRTVKAPGRNLTAFSDPATPSAILITTEEGTVIPPGSLLTLDAKVIDQYGASAFAPAPLTVKTDNASVVAQITSDGRVSLRAAADAKKSTRFTLTVQSGQLSASETFTINDLPLVSEYTIEGLPRFIEKGTPLKLKVTGTDQYGVVHEPEVSEWILNNGSEDTKISGSFTPNTPGRFSLRAIGTDAVKSELATAEVVVLPILNNLASTATVISSSEENVGTSTANANDGDPNSRWGSAHTDNEWIILDLGEDTYLTSAEIDWEAAYGADYDFEMAPANCPLVTFTGTYAGQTHQSMIPAEEAWITVGSVRGNNRSGKVFTRLDGSGRYLRMKGISRGSAYGYSLYEISVRGVNLSLPEDAIVGIDFGLPEVTDQDKEIILSPVAYTLTGQPTSVSVKWMADKEAEFKGNSFLPLGYGLYTLTARSDAGLESSGSIFVNESTRLQSMALTPATAHGITNEKISLKLESSNQFGGLYPVDSESGFEVRVTEKDTGAEVDATETFYDLDAGEFRSSKKGVYLVDVTYPSGTLRTIARVEVVDITEANLALGKAAVASSAENGGLTAPFAVDGNYSTRWGSQFRDDQTITVNLGNRYRLTDILIYWDDVAYATDYLVEISDDGIEFSPLFSRESWSGEIGLNSCRLDAFELPVRTFAQFVKITGLRRSTQYGTSIKELEVYGDEVFLGIDTSNTSISETDYDSPIYNLQGIRLRTGEDDLKARPLSPGLYIRAGKIINL